ncbi:MAG: HEAT repeat domain-containing protein [Fusobacteriota bacterium]
MDFFANIINFFLVLLGILISIIFIKHFYSNVIDKKKKNLRKRDLDYILDKLILDQEITFSKNEINEELIDGMIEIINSISGSMRRKLIKAIKKNGIIDYVYNKYKKARSKYKKEYYLYVLGELRCNKYIGDLLEEDLEELKKDKLLVSYFFALVVIIDEWIFSLKKNIIFDYIDRLITVTKFMEEYQNWNTKRLMDYFLNQTDNFFIYAIDNFEIIDYFLDQIYEKKLGLEVKGEILYIISLNREYKIVDFLESEFYKYINKEKEEEEREYLIKIIKSLSVLGLESSNDLFLEGIESEDWVIRSESVKGLGNFKKNMDMIYMKLFDESWWVRYNSALAISKFGSRGKSTLFFALKSTVDDQYAKEIAAYVLVDKIYTNMIKRLALEGNLEIIINEIIIIINQGNNMNILDEVMTNPDFSNEQKINLISKVNSNKFYSYYEDVLKNDQNISEEIKDLISKKKRENQNLT